MADQADKLASSDPDYAIRDLHNAIAEGNFPTWNLNVQIMTFEEAEKFRYNPFDLTKVMSQRQNSYYYDFKDRSGRDRMVGGYTITCAISAYHY